jgi:sphingosine kinase
MPKVEEGGRLTTLPTGWNTFDDDEFLVFWVCNTTHAAHNMFTCPVAKMHDGLFHILIVRSSCTRLRLITMLLTLDSGRHFESPDLVYVPCVAYQFEPLAPDVSYNILDGEALVNGTVQAHMLPGGIQFFCGLERLK